MPTRAVNRIHQYYELRGEGEPLTLIVGLGTDISEWERIIAPLAQRYQVLAFDNRGAGRSDQPDQPYSIELMAADIAGLLRAVGIERTHLLGVSLGGRVALALTLAHPEVVNQLALVSTSARAARRPWWFGALSLLSSAPIFQSSYPQPRYAFRRQRQASSSVNCLDRLGEIHAPTLILHGRRDKTVPFALADEMQAGITDSRLLAFEGSHTFFFWRERQPSLEAVTAFLSAESS